MSLFSKPYENQISVGTGVTTPWIILPQRRVGNYFQRLALVLGPDGTGSGRIETTFDTIANVKADNAAPGTIPTIMPKAWPSGDITDDIVQDAVLPPTAYRVVNLAGDLFLQARGV